MAYPRRLQGFRDCARREPLTRAAAAGSTRTFSVGMSVWASVARSTTPSTCDI